MSQPSTKKLKEAADASPATISFATNRQKIVVDGTVSGFTAAVSADTTFGKCLVSPQPGIPTRLLCKVTESAWSFEEAVKFIYKFQQSSPPAFQNKCDFAVFSWPARGDTGLPSIAKAGPIGTLVDNANAFARYYDYVVDGASCDASEQPLADFIEDRLRNSNKKLHVIGHSMGCQLLIRALTQLVLRARIDQLLAGKLSMLGSVTFAAADVDRRLFIASKEVLVDNLMSCKFLMFVSDADLVLTASRLLHEAPRAGLVNRPLMLKLQPINREFGGRLFDKIFKFGEDDAVAHDPIELGKGRIVDSSGAKEDRLGYDDDQTYINTLHFDFLFVEACRDELRAVIENTQPQPSTADVIDLVAA